MSTSAAKTTMTGESWDVFTKRALVEKRICGIMRENSGEPRPLGPKFGWALFFHLFR